MILDSIDVDLDQDTFLSHPIILIDSFKSLIGIDLEKSKKIRHNLTPYINSYISLGKPISSSNKKVSDFNSANVSISLISLYDILKTGDINNCETIIFEILNVSDGKHILEYLLELSLLQSGKSFIIITSIIRCMEFCDSPNMFKFILLAAKAIILDEDLEPVENKSFNNVFNIENYVLTNFQLIIFGYLIDFQNKTWIRKDKINNNLDIFKKNIFNETKLFTYKNNYKFIKQIKACGRVCLLDFIDLDNFSIMDLFHLNAIRCLIKNNIPNNISAYYLNQLFEENES